MRTIVLLSAMFITHFLQAQNPSDSYEEKVETLDSTIKTLYSVISGEKAEPRDWELFKYLFKEDAKLIPTRKSKEGDIGVVYWSPQKYIETAGKWLLENGFFEKEIHRETQTFGNITQIFSTYESYRSATDTEPFARGINSIQLLNDGNRWWVINIFWMAEDEDYPIPDKFLPKQ